MKNVFLSELVQHSYGLPIKVYLCQVERNLLHWHSDIEFIYCVSGSLHLETKKDSYIIQKNDVVLINKNTVHRLTKTSEENIIFILQIDLSRYAGYVHDINNFTFKCNSISNPDYDYSHLIRFFYQFIDVFSKDPLGKIVRLRNLTDSIVIYLLDKFPFDLTVLNEKDESVLHLKRLNQIFHYVEKNYQTHISLDEIAFELHMSRYYFSHFFKKRTGSSFYTYLKQYRLEQSIRLLMQSDSNILEIANNCGFSSVQAYIKYFKEAYNSTPSKYRKAISSQSSDQNRLSTKYSEYTLLDPQIVLNTITEIV